MESDWLDAYLDELTGEVPPSQPVIPVPTRPVLTIQQRRHHFDAAALYEHQQRIAEARREIENSLHSGDSDSASGSGTSLVTFDGDIIVGLDGIPIVSL